MLGRTAVSNAEKQLIRWAQLDAHRVTLGLPSDTLQQLYYHMLLARLTDERLAELYARGIISRTPSCRGHEAAQVGCAFSLTVGTDYILPYYRDMALMLAIGISPTTIFLNQLERAGDPISGGRMRPAQWNSFAHRVVSASGLVATQTLHAAGIAFAAKVRGETNVAMTFFGEGATSEGDFHEALNFAGVHRLGVIFVCENNGIALSTPQSRQMATEYVADRAAAYGMPGIIVEGFNVLAVITAAQEAVERARSGQGPTLIEIIVPRLGTPPPGEDEMEDPRDPVAFYRSYLLARGDMTTEQDQQMHQEIAMMLDSAERDALAADPPDPASALEFSTSMPADEHSREGG